MSLAEKTSSRHPRSAMNPPKWRTPSITINPSDRRTPSKRLTKARMQFSDCSPLVHNVPYRLPLKKITKRKQCTCKYVRGSHLAWQKKGNNNKHKKLNCEHPGNL